MRKQIPIGTRLGHLTVIAFEGIRNRESCWLCRCDCGRVISLSGGAVRMGQKQCRPCAADRRVVKKPGDRVGRLVLLEMLKEEGARYWLVKCDCGVVKKMKFASLNNLRSPSCGCVRHLHHKGGPRKHGHSSRRDGRSITYKSWMNMLTRCGNPNSKEYHNYGGRGIVVCEEWHRFERFLADMGERPSPAHSIDRFPDKNGNYEPGNCRWATPREQANNTRRNNLITFNGETMSMMEWAVRLGVPRNIIKGRIERGWSDERALMEPVKGPISREGNSG